MHYQWINKKNNKELILFFNGWAMNETAIGHLDKENYDILMLFDYRNIESSFLSNILTKEIESKYEKKYLVCWSMGVYVSNLFSDKLENFNKKIAINGTNKIIDNDFGIAEKVYSITAKFLNLENCKKFINNMFNDKTRLCEIRIDRQIEELKEELYSIQELQLNNSIASKSNSIANELKFDKAIISNQDIIIPTKNQIAFWQDRLAKSQIEIIESTHCPFKNYKSWQEILC